MDENGLEIGNDGRATHHWTRGSQEGESVFNLTWANLPITQWYILANDHTTGFDHEDIECKVDADTQEEADHDKVVGWNLSAMKVEDVEAAEKRWTELAKERVHLDEQCTADKLEQEAARCQEAMGNVLDTAAKKIRICARSPRWWNADIKK